MTIARYVSKGGVEVLTDRPDFDIDTWEFRKKSYKQPIIDADIATGESGLDRFWDLVREELGPHSPADISEVDYNMNKITLKPFQIEKLRPFSKWLGTSELIDVLADRKTGDVYSAWIQAPVLNEDSIKRIYNSVIGDDTFFDESVKQNKWQGGAGAVTWECISGNKIPMSGRVNFESIRDAFSRIYRLGDILESIRHNKAVKDLHEEEKAIIEENNRRLAAFMEKRDTILGKEIKKTAIKDEQANADV